MKTIPSFLIILFLAGCVYKVPLRNEYPGKPLYGYSDRSIGEVWDRIIDVITDEGLSLKFIDKNSGFVMSDDLSVDESRTVEDRNGKLVDPNAYVVSERDNSDYRYFFPDIATAKWSIVLRETEDGKTAIKIALSNIIVKETTPKYMNFKAYSLGNFENWLYNEIK